MTVEQSVGSMPPRRGAEVARPVVTPAEPGTWLLLLVPILICVGMVAFMAFAPA